MREPREFEAPLCAEVGGDWWFPEKEVADDKEQLHSIYAKRICGSCQHRVECAEWGIHHEQYGIWGGLNGRRLAAIRREKNIRREDPSASIISRLE